MSSVSDPSSLRCTTCRSSTPQLFHPHREGDICFFPDEDYWFHYSCASCRCEILIKNHELCFFSDFREALLSHEKKYCWSCFEVQYPPGKDPQDDTAHTSARSALRSATKTKASNMSSSESNAGESGSNTSSTHGSNSKKDHVAPIFLANKCRGKMVDLTKRRNLREVADAGVTQSSEVDVSKRSSPSSSSSSTPVAVSAVSSTSSSSATVQVATQSTAQDEESEYIAVTASMTEGEFLFKTFAAEIPESSREQVTLDSMSKVKRDRLKKALPASKLKTHSCRVCPTSKPYLAIWKSKANLLSHLKGKHGAMLQEALEYFRTQQLSASQRRAEKGRVRVQVKQRAKMETDDKRIADVHLANLIVQESLSIHIGEKKSMRDWIDSFHGVGNKRYLPATAKTVVKYIACWEAVTKEELRNVYEAATKASLQGFRRVSFQYDIWLNGKMESVIGITGSCYQEHEGFSTACLALQHLEGTHTGEAVMGAVRDAAVECIIPMPDGVGNTKSYMRRICDSVTTDGGSDAKKSASLLGCSWIHCFSHRLNLAVKDSMRHSKNASFLKELDADLDWIGEDDLPSDDEDGSDSLDVDAFITSAESSTQGGLQGFQRSSDQVEETEAEQKRYRTQTITKFTTLAADEKAFDKVKDDFEEAKNTLEWHNLGEELVELMKKIQGRAVQSGRSGYVRRHLKVDQRANYIQPASLKKTFEIRWLSLYDSAYQDLLLQHTLMRVYSAQSQMYRAADTGKRSSFQKLEPSVEDYELLSQFLAVLILPQQACLALQKEHVTLGEAHTIVMTLKQKLGKSSKHLFEVKGVEEKVSQENKKGERVVTVTHFQREDLLPDVQEFCDLLKAGLTSRFPEVPDDLVMLSMVTDFRFSLFTYSDNQPLRKALRTRATKLLKEAMRRVIEQKRSETTESSSEEEEEEQPVATEKTRADLLAEMDSPVKAPPPRSASQAKKTKSKKRRKLLSTEVVLEDEWKGKKQLEAAFNTNEACTKGVEQGELSLNDVANFYKSQGAENTAFFEVFISSNVVAATSVNPERLFSNCGNFETKRNKGTASTLLNTARSFLKCNYKLLPKAVKVKKYIEYIDGRTKPSTNRKYYEEVENVKMRQEWSTRFKVT